MNDAKMIIRGIFLTTTMIGQIILALVLHKKSGCVWLINLGWFILWISAIFGWLPIFTFKKWGNVPKGKNYINTTALVDRGIYAIVRHPQYLAGILISIALPMISQHWLVIIPGMITIIITYIDTLEEDKSSVAKFGSTYCKYMQNVPRLNFLLGIIRFLKKKGET